MSDVIPRVRADHQAWFNLAESVNRQGHGVMAALRSDVSDNRQLLVGLLLPRLLSSLQGCLLMAERGMAVEASALARVCLETFFVLKAIAQSEEAIELIQSADSASRRKKITSILSSPKMRAALSDEQVRTLEELFPTLSKDDLKIQRAAELAGHQDDYNTMYRTLSDHAHPSLSALERYAVRSADGNEITGFSFGPEYYEPKTVIGPAVHAAILGIDATCRAFDRKPGHNLHAEGIEYARLMAC